MKPIIAYKGKIIARDFMTAYPSGEPAWKPGLEVPRGSVIGMQWNGSVNDIVALCSWLSTTEYTPFGCSLVLPFLPCSRQDKTGPIEGDQSRGAQFILNMLQESNIESVELLDNHSTEILKPYREFVANRTLASVLPDDEYIDFEFAISPDNGSLSRTHQVAGLYKIPVVCGSKCRDQASGRITHYSLPLPVSLKYMKVIIVDDIIDGGYTFELLANEVKALCPNAELTLVCTHGVLSGFPNMPECFRHYSNVWITDSCRNAETLKYVDNLKMQVKIIDVVERMTIERSLINA